MTDEEEQYHLEHHTFVGATLRLARVRDAFLVALLSALREGVVRLTARVNRISGKKDLPPRDILK